MIIIPRAMSLIIIILCYDTSITYSRKYERWHPTGHPTEIVGIVEHRISI